MSICFDNQLSYWMEKSVEMSFSCGRDNESRRRHFRSATCGCRPPVFPMAAGFGGCSISSSYNTCCLVSSAALVAVSRYTSVGRGAAIRSLARHFLDKNGRPLHGFLLLFLCNNIFTAFSCCFKQNAQTFFASAERCGHSPPLSSSSSCPFLFFFLSLCLFFHFSPLRFISGRNSLAPTHTDADARTAHGIVRLRRHGNNKIRGSHPQKKIMKKKQNPHRSAGIRPRRSLPRFTRQFFWVKISAMGTWRPCGPTRHVGCHCDVYIYSRTQKHLLHGNKLLLHRRPKEGQAVCLALNAVQQCQWAN